MPGCFSCISIERKRKQSSKEDPVNYSFSAPNQPDFSKISDWLLNTSLSQNKSEQSNYGKSGPSERNSFERCVSFADFEQKVQYPLSSPPLSPLRSAMKRGFSLRPGISANDLCDKEPLPVPLLGEHSEEENSIHTVPEGRAEEEAGPVAKGDAVWDVSFVETLPTPLRTENAYGRSSVDSRSAQITNGVEAGAPSLAEPLAKVSADVQFAAQSSSEPPAGRGLHEAWAALLDLHCCRARQGKLVLEDSVSGFTGALDSTLSCIGCAPRRRGD